jgi:hypothetical protein
MSVAGSRAGIRKQTFERAVGAIGESIHVRRQSSDGLAHVLENCGERGTQGGPNAECFHTACKDKR